MGFRWFTLQRGGGVGRSSTVWQNIYFEVYCIRERPARLHIVGGSAFSARALDVKANWVGQGTRICLFVVVVRANATKSPHNKAACVVYGAAEMIKEKSGGGVLQNGLHVCAKLFSHS